MTGVAAGTIDIVALTICVFTMFGYHLYIFWKVHQRKLGVTLSIMLITGPRFIGKHLVTKDAASTTLAIQTLRNTILIIIFLGSTSFTTAYQILRETAAEDDLTLSLPQIRGVIVASLLFFSFLNFALTLRCASHLGYLIGSATGGVPPFVSDVQMARLGSSGSTFGPSGTPIQQRAIEQAEEETESKKGEITTEHRKLRSTGIEGITLTSGAETVPSTSSMHDAPITSGAEWAARFERDENDKGKPPRGLQDYSKSHRSFVPVEFTIDEECSDNTSDMEKGLHRVRSSYPVPAPIIEQQPTYRWYQPWQRIRGMVRTRRKRRYSTNVHIESVMAAQADKMIYLMTVHFSFGFRGFYMAIPFAFLSAGPIPFLVSSIIIFIFLVYNDHATS